VKFSIEEDSVLFLLSFLLSSNLYNSKANKEVPSTIRFNRSNNNLRYVGGKFGEVGIIGSFYISGKVSGILLNRSPALNYLLPSVIFP
jgi:hypothetical protein